jgi:hypothetical protein
MNLSLIVILLAALGIGVVAAGIVLVLVALLIDKNSRNDDVERR